MILVADPTRMTAELLCRRFRADGYTALAFATANGALSRAGQRDIEAIIVDPALDASIVPKLRSAAPGVPILAFGTNDRPQDVAAALASGANAFLVKGRVSPSQLVARMQALIAGNKTSATSAGEATGAMDGSYYVQLDPRAGDAARLAIDVGAGAGLKCAHCGGGMSLFLQRDLARWGKWLFGTFGCLVCARRRPKAQPMTTILPADFQPIELEPLAAAGGTR